mmetsp:Transcript_13673/g.28761  ORF Transcript_13673/g.28761 Transcript_13673/m.28761 type:complete len:428 (+) Transcript_13673:226-1509(+)
MTTESRGCTATTNSLLIQTVFNHACWSSMHVAARYLQVYAQPMKFDGQGVLASAKGSAAIFLFLVGLVSSWVDRHCYLTKNDKESTETINVSKKEAMSGMDWEDKDPANKSTRKKIFYTLLFAFVSTSRASLNVASAKFTYPYNITLIASLTPAVIAIFDAIFLQSPFPPLLWPTISISGFCSALIAISQTRVADGRSLESNIISRRDNALGCALQLLSAVFSAFARILMKHTEHILTPTHVVQTNNISNCIFPLIYTLLQNPSSWRAFQYILGNPRSLIAWLTMSILVYSLASSVQIRLVRKLGPGLYSSWVAVRVMGSILLSAIVLGEKVNSLLEWIGIGIMICTVSIYVVNTKKWMDDGRRVDSGEVQDDEVNDGNEELVSLTGESRPLLGDSTTICVSNAEDALPRRFSGTPESASSPSDKSK